MEVLGKKAINSSQIEFVCYSKLRTLLNLYKAGIPIPKTVFVPCDATDVMKNGKEIHNEKDIADLFEAEIPLTEGIVIKADAGTHGKMIMLSKDRAELEANIKETKPNIINPIGVVAQELIQKWFYDLRIIVSKEARQRTRLLSYRDGSGGLQRFPHQHLPWQLGLPLQTARRAFRS